MTTAAVRALPAAERRRRIALGLLRAAVVAAVLIAVYYVAPLSRLADVPLGLLLAIGMTALVTVATLQVRAVIRARHPGIRAIQALTTIAPLFLLLFAVTYFVMAQTDVGSFDEEAFTRTDALYFTVTVFATVGFGDITPASQAARLVVSTQMILDLIVLGLGIRVLLGAVELGRQRPDNGPQEETASPERPDLPPS